MKLTTRLNALDTGFGCAMTEQPNTSMTMAKNQKSSGGMALEGIYLIAADSKKRKSVFFLFLARQPAGTAI
jgi:hypothetical protein